MLHNDRNFGAVLTGAMLDELLKDKTPNEKEQLLKQLVADHTARAIAQHYATHSIVDDIKFLSKRENRDRLIDALQFVAGHLPKMARLMDEDDDVRFIRVTDAKDENYFWCGKATRYLLEEEEHLKKVIARIKETKWPKWQWRKEAIRQAVEEIRESHEHDGIKMDWEEIGYLILEIFGEEAQKKSPQDTARETPGDVADWIRQLVNRK